MKRHIERWRLTAAALLAVGAACAFASNAGAQDPCDPVADRLLEAKLYDKARIAYAQIERAAARDGTEPPECVQAGLAQIFQARAEATRHYERGQAYEEAEKPELARDEYVEALRADPTFDEVSAALDSLLQSPTAPTTFEQRLEVVRALERAGLHEAAVEELKEAVKAHPGESLPPDMRNLVGGTVSPWGEFRGWIDPRRSTAVDFLRFAAEVLILLLLLWVIFGRLVPWIRRQRGLRLDIQDFDKGATGLELSKAFSALVEEALRECDTSGRRSRVELLTGPIDKDVGIRNITNLDPRVNLISQLIDVILPPNVVTLAGSLQRSKARGAGVSVTLTHGTTGRMLANESIWLQPYDPKTASVVDDTEPFYDLVEPTAIWTLYSLQEYRSRDRGRR